MAAEFHVITVNNLSVIHNGINAVNAHVNPFKHTNGTNVVNNKRNICG